MPDRLTIWCNAQFPEDAQAELVAGTASHRLVFAERQASNLAAGSPNAQLAQADIAFGQPDPGQMIDLQSLRWVHLTSAGYTRYDRDDLRKALKQRGAMLTNSSGVFDEPCAQQVLAFMLGFARQLPQSMAVQVGGHVWQYEKRRRATKLLANQTVLILGFGAIARRLVELLGPFRLNLIAMRQKVRGDEPIPTHAISELDWLLPTADHVVNALPSSPSTDRLIDAKRFAAMKAGAIFYNIGRGTTIVQEGLIQALQSGHLGGAYLDVTDPEPLPPENPLWSAPNCYITPHIGGGHMEEFVRLVRHFLNNLHRFESGQALIDRVM